MTITVSDRGTGITAEHLPRIFDPFFTTKRVGGTGLGLSVSYGLLQRYGGDIKVTSEPGQGSTFEVFVPAQPVFMDQRTRVQSATREEPEAELVSSKRH